MIYYLADAKYVDGYRFWARFNTGEEGEVNLKDVLAPTTKHQALRTTHYARMSKSRIHECQTFKPPTLIAQTEVTNGAISCDGACDQSLDKDG
ncbi:MAG: hypothetical protein R6U98_20460 [Pirellulaceae bacterium]